MPESHSGCEVLRATPGTEQPTAGSGLAGLYHPSPLHCCCLGFYINHQPGLDSSCPNQDSCVSVNVQKLPPLVCTSMNCGAYMDSSDQHTIRVQNSSITPSNSLQLLLCSAPSSPRPWRPLICSDTALFLFQEYSISGTTHGGLGDLRDVSTVLCRCVVPVIAKYCPMWLRRLVWFVTVAGRLGCSQAWVIMHRL